MGDDVIFGDYGADTLRGGDGADTFVYNSNTTKVDPTYYDPYRTLRKMKTAPHVQQVVLRGTHNAPALDYN